MDGNLKNHIEYLLCVKITAIRPISGGDISQAFLLETETEQFFCKINRNEQAFQMFQNEKAGLEAISKTKTIATPKVFLCDKLEDGAFFLMEYIEAKKNGSNNMKALGHQLAALHLHSRRNEFGWKTDNFIGSLPQSNKKHSNWVKFYVEERLLPQLKMAYDSGGLNAAEIPVERLIFERCKNLLPKVKPSLLHGDLWSGNYLISENGTPFLIDPAVYYGHHEVDIAMTKLFGGFDTSFYNAYSEIFPKIGQEKERHEIYQLYYLLVHLNLFGGSYKSSVMEIIKKYF